MCTCIQWYTFLTIMYAASLVMLWHDWCCRIKNLHFLHRLKELSDDVMPCWSVEVWTSVWRSVMKSHREEAAEPRSATFSTKNFNQISNFFQFLQYLVTVKHSESYSLDCFLHLDYWNVDKYFGILFELSPLHHVILEDIQILK